MKFSHVFMVVLFPFLTVFGQWEFQNPSFTAEDLYAVKFINSSKGFAAGENGTLIKTTTGGSSWTLIRTGVKSRLNYISFPDAKNGFISGRDGTLLRTTDGGNTWKKLTSASGNSVNTMFFTDSKTGFLGCYGGLLLKTSDAGNSWQTIPLNLSLDITSISFASPTVGWMSLSAWSSSKLYKTLDGGKTWAHQQNYPNYVRKIVFPNIYNGWVLEAYPYKLTNGGSISTNTGFVVSKGGVVNISFLNDNNGWLLTYEGTGPIASPWAVNSNFVYSTIDGGNSWKQSNPIMDNIKINDFYFSDSRNGWAVGQYGTVYNTSDGGLHWYNQLNPINVNFSSVGFSDKRNGYAAGGSWNHGYVYRTTNGGKNWDYFISTDYEISSVSVVDSNTIWISGDVVSLIKNGIKYDKFGSKVTIQPTIKYPNITFTDPLHGWCTYKYISDPYSQSGIRFTKDGGTTWKAVDFDRNTNSGAEKVFSSDSLNCWIIGGSDIIRTTDGGVKWFTQPPMSDVFFFDLKTGWGSSGSALYYSEDGGVSWTEKQNFGGKIKFLDRLNGFVLGSSTVYSTTDGGQTWSGIPYTAKAMDFVFADKEEGWIVGDGGVILHYPASTAPADTSGSVDNGDNGGNQDTTGNVTIATEYSLSQNYPNPFNMGTNISFDLPLDSFVSLKVLDITGREIATLVNENVTAGIHTVHFDAKGLSSGIYFYRITAGGFSQIKKLILLK